MKLSGDLSGFRYGLFYFLFYAGFMPFLFYLPVYLKYFGLSPLYVGVLNGLRPILQSVGTPFLIMLGKSLRSTKLLFIMSSVIMVSKVLIIFLILLPKRQECTVMYFGQYDRHKTNHHMLPLVEESFVKRKSASQEPRSSTVRGRFASDAEDTNVNPVTFKQTGNGSDVVLNNKYDYRDSGGKNSNFSERKDDTRSTQSHTTSLYKVLTPKGPRRNKYYVVFGNEDDAFRIFLVLFLLTLLGDSFDSTIFTLVDHSCMDDYQGTKDYGLFRLWGNAAWALMTPVIGAVIHYFNHEMCGTVVGSYHYAFFFTIGFLLLSFLVGLFQDFTTNDMDIAERRVHGPTSSFQYGLFLFALFFSGFCNGFLLTFTNWFIVSLGGNAVIMGLAAGCKSVVDIVLFFVLVKITTNICHQLIINVGLVGHIVVFLIYYYIEDAWFVIVASIFHAFSYAVITYACNSFLSARAPTGSIVKMQVLLQGVYWGIGTGFGAIFGGYHLEYSGFLETFAMFIVMTSIVATVFLTIQILSYFYDPEGALEEIWKACSSNGNSTSDSEYDFDFNGE